MHITGECLSWLRNVESLVGAGRAYGQSLYVSKWFIYIVQDTSASYDAIDRDPDPTPDRYYYMNFHGTNCAGEIASVANNSYCSIGIAHNSKIEGRWSLCGDSKRLENIYLLWSVLNK